MNNLQECDFSSPHKSSLWNLPYSLPWWETSIIVRRENDHIQRNYDKSPRIKPDLQGDYCNRRHLDKADQSDYKKITIHSRKVGGGPISSSWQKRFSRYHLQFHWGWTLISSIRVFWLFSAPILFPRWQIHNSAQCWENFSNSTWPSIFLYFFLLQVGVSKTPYLGNDVMVLYLQLQWCNKFADLLF